jgi:hypothetical protein
MINAVASRPYGAFWTEIQRQSELAMGGEKGVVI